MQKELTTLFTGRQVISLGTVMSTNSYLSDLLRMRIMPEGTLLKASSQSAGRGQGETRWFSEKGKNMLVSIAFFPVFLHVKDIFMLNKAYSLGIFDYVKSHVGSDVRIKWPNDIYFKNKKICGILVENQINSSSINQSILGIGLNVNQDVFPDFLDIAISMSQIIGKELNLDEEINALCNFLEARYLQLKRGEYDLLNRDYLNVLYRFDEWFPFEKANTVFTAKITGIDPSGRLTLKSEDGQVVSYDTKEIRFI
ncbi:MAG: biotin--[acetyl-CoA-carboxylase] ligase [Bacteroidetes bacterium]|nr:biotin--[acetyl-CoA-carboxylase] ligase [Bacteroidota bacterium]